MFNAGSNSFKPKYQKLKGSLPFPATFNKILNLKKLNLTTYVAILLFIWFFLNPFSLVSNIFRGNSLLEYPPGHPLTSKNTIETTSKYIYPPIEDAPLLKQLGVSKLVHESRVRDANAPEIEKIIVRSLNAFDDPNPETQNVKEENENAVLSLSRAKNRFKNQDKVVYKPKNTKNYPDIVIVTAVDFEKYSVDALTKIVQNKVDYAHEQNYGVYVRWYQEFLPVLNSMDILKSKEKAKWMRLYCLRAAMFAFPEAKWFWYIDQDSLIMDMSINLQDYLLSPEALNPVILKEQPIIPPDGRIKTYRNSNADLTKLIITQSENKVESHSFLVKNDYVGRAIIEAWAFELFSKYENFPFGPDSALTHLLQWHPFILSKSSIVPARTIAAQHSPIDLPVDKNGKAGDHIHYYDGDLAAFWSNCGSQEECEKFLDLYYSRLKGKKSNQD